MTAQTLDRILTSYRIGDPDGAYPLFDETGSKLWPGRWNTAGSPMIYTSEHYSTAMLEKLVHGSGRMPPRQHWAEIRIPPSVACESFSEAHHPGWDAEDGLVSKAYGEALAALTAQARGRDLLFKGGGRTVFEQVPRQVYSDVVMNDVKSG